MRELQKSCRVALALVTALAPGCGYQSQYVAPDGYRARPLYTGNQVVAVVPPGLPKCASELETAPPPPPEGAPPPPPMMEVDDRGNWSGSSVNITVVHVGHHPVPPHWLWFPHPNPLTPPGPHQALFAGPGGGGGGGGGGGQGEGKAMAALIAIMIGVAIVASAGVAIGLAADPPESQEVRDGMDEVNAYNDAARRKITRCLEEARKARPPPAGAPKPQEGW